MPNHCPNCGTAIIPQPDGNFCSCGQWGLTEQLRIDPLEDAIDYYNEIHTGEIITGDHYTGTCIALWKGDYESCMRVKQFIKDLYNE